MGDDDIIYLSCPFCGTKQGKTAAEFEHLVDCPECGKTGMFVRSSQSSRFKAVSHPEPTSGLKPLLRAIVIIAFIIGSYVAYRAQHPRYGDGYRTHDDATLGFLVQYPTNYHVSTSVSSAPLPDGTKISIHQFTAEGSDVIEGFFVGTYDFILDDIRADRDDFQIATDLFAGAMNAIGLKPGPLEGVNRKGGAVYHGQAKGVYHGENALNGVDVWCVAEIRLFADQQFMLLTVGRNEGVFTDPHGEFFFDSFTLK